jgi:hypothetical protein
LAWLKVCDYATSEYERVFPGIVNVESSARVNVMQEKVRISECGHTKGMKLIMSLQI